MTLSIDLPPELEKRLKQEAERRGLEPAKLVLEAVEAVLPKPSGRTGLRVDWPLPVQGVGLKTVDEHLRKRREAGLEALPFYETATPEEWIQAMREWADPHEDWPVLSPEADSREAMYEELTLRNLAPERDLE